jgi:hypothetical protein
LTIVVTTRRWPCQREQTIDRIFIYNRTVRNLPLALQLQLMPTYCFGAVNYLQGVVEHTPMSFKYMDTAVHCKPSEPR